MSHSARAPLRSLNHPHALTGEGAKALQAVRGLVAALSQSARFIEQRTGVTNAQLFLLQQIAADTNLSVNALAARAMTHQSTASVVLSRLERRGLVQRVPSPVDGRSVVLHLTPAGRRLLRRAPAPATSEIVDAISRLTPSEVKMLRTGLVALAREAGFKSDDSPMLFQEAEGKATSTRSRRAGAKPRAPTGRGAPRARR
jgi:MarR family transcriptional regulator, lower aerobic nicotinate degradation pathway regulator